MHTHFDDEGPVARNYFKVLEQLLLQAYVSITSRCDSFSDGVLHMTMPLIGHKARNGICRITAPTSPRWISGNALSMLSFILCAGSAAYKEEGTVKPHTQPSAPFTNTLRASEPNTKHTALSKHKKGTSCDTDSTIVSCCSIVMWCMRSKRAP